MGPNQTDKLWHSKGNQKKKKTKKQTDKGLISKIYKHLYNSTAKNPTTQLKNGQKTSVDISPKKIHRWPSGT